MGVSIRITSTRRLTDVRKWFSYDPIDGTAVSGQTTEMYEIGGTVTGADPIPNRYYRDKPAWLPDRVEVSYDRADRGDWRMQRVTVRGHPLKADGSPGRRDVSRSWWDVEDEIPVWVAEFVTVNTPKDDPSTVV